jgi:hypothetical protein
MQYTERFYNDFFASIPIKEKPTEWINKTNLKY